MRLISIGPELLQTFMSFPRKRESTQRSRLLRPELLVKPALRKFGEVPEVDRSIAQVL